MNFRKITSNLLLGLLALAMPLLAGAQLTAEFSQTYLVNPNCIAGGSGRFLELRANDEAASYSWTCSTPHVKIASPTSRVAYLSVDPTQGFLNGSIEVFLEVSDGEVGSVIGSKTISLNLHFAPLCKLLPGYQIEGCAPLTVNFQAAPFSMNGTEVTSYAWQFGEDGTVEEAGDEISHTYTEAGQYEVILEMTDAEGCKGTNKDFLHKTIVVVKPTSSCR